ncbi:MAG TPA: ion channel [Burkholderiaceae bacterium]
MEKHRRTVVLELMHLAALLALTPAFYLVLAGPGPVFRNLGYLLYAGVALALLTIGHATLHNTNAVQRLQRRKYAWLDRLIILGALASAWPGGVPWNSIEWALRLGYCCLVFARMPSLLFARLALNRLWQVCLLAVSMLAVGGAGFLWLEPNVGNYADGVWLAFTTGATVGYGDLVPSTAASRILAAFIVLLGYALFSLLTANIAALLVGEDEKKLRRELHADLRALRQEIAALQERMRAQEIAVRPVSANDCAYAGREIAPERDSILEK